MTQTLDRLSQTLDRLKQTLDRLRQTLDRLSQTLDRLSQTLDRLKKDLREVNQSPHRVTQVFVNQTLNCNSLQGWHVICGFLRYKKTPKLIENGQWDELIWSPRLRYQRQLFLEYLPRYGEFQSQRVSCYEESRVGRGLLSTADQWDHLNPGMSELAPKWVRLARNGTNPWLFQIRFQYTLARQFVLKSDLKKSRICATPKCTEI